MKKVNSEMEDDVRAEYDFKNMRVRKLGPKRKSFAGTTICLEPDVAKVFHSAESVNEALRFVIKVADKSQLAKFGIVTESSLG